METITTQQTSNQQNGYSLDFLKNDNGDFQSRMMNYIQSKFGDMLSERELEMLKSGDTKALDLLSQRFK